MVGMLYSSFVPRAEVLDNLGRLALEFESLSGQLMEMHGAPKYGVNSLGQSMDMHDMAVLGSARSRRLALELESLSGQLMEMHGASKYDVSGLGQSTEMYEVAVHASNTLGSARSRLTEFIHGPDLQKLREVVKQNNGISCSPSGDVHAAAYNRRLLQHVVDSERCTEDLLFSMVLQLSGSEYSDAVLECHEMWHFDESAECIAVEVSPRLDADDSVIVTFRIAITLCATLRGISCKFDSTLYATQRDARKEVEPDILECLKEAHKSYFSKLCDVICARAGGSRRKTSKVRFSTRLTDSPSELKPNVCASQADNSRSAGQVGDSTSSEPAPNGPSKHCKEGQAKLAPGPPAACSKELLDSFCEDTVSKSQIPVKPFQKSKLRRGGVQSSTEHVFEGLKERFNIMEKLEESSAEPPDAVTTDIEFVRILDPFQFKLFLQNHGIPVNQYGDVKRKTKTVQELFAEVILRECTLVEVPQPTLASRSLERRVRVIFLEIEAFCGNESKFMLLKNETSEYTSRFNLNTRPSKKMFDDEDVDDATWRCLYQNFDIARIDGPGKDNFKMVSVQNWTETKRSAGFPGLPTVYDVHVVHLRISDPSHQDLSKIGLPAGEEFQTSSQFISHRTTRSWRWCHLDEFLKAKAATAGTVVVRGDETPLTS